MSFKSGLVIGLLVGYYYGAKAGRGRYEQIEEYLRPIRESEAWHQGSELAKGLVTEVVDAGRRAARDASSSDPTGTLRRIA